MMKLNYLINALICLCLYACHADVKREKKHTLHEGKWLMKMTLEEGIILPFEFTLNHNNSVPWITIINGEEKIIVKEIEQRNDSLFIQLPVFESEFLLKIINNSTLSGVWINHYKGDDYKIPANAKAGKTSRFKSSNSSPAKFKGRYKVVFSPETEDSYNAVGLFEQDNNILNGTFATETGDYRHLSGNVSGDSIYLSTFDGSHAFLFKAHKTDSVIKGIFYSGTHWKEDWIAEKNDSFELKNADSLTYLKEGYETISFSFPNSDNKYVSLNDEQYQDKAVIVQIMGSWCPNCLDETTFFTELYNAYHNQGLEIIALAFERTKTKEKAIQNLKRLKNNTGASYEFLLAGATRKDKAEEKLPMLNHVMSYPTAIFIDKNKKVRRIHTGFYGPSTGKYYEDYVQKTKNLIEKMLNE